MIANECRIAYGRYVQHTEEKFNKRKNDNPRMPKEMYIWVTHLSVDQEIVEEFGTVSE